MIEEIKREKEAASRQFIITDDLKVVSSEILAGKPPIEYVERKELEKVNGALKTTYLFSKPQDYTDFHEKTIIVIGF